MRFKAMEERKHSRRPGEQGFALILAILSLMLLTFLGLTLATTTSTELQIATNYRWAQQAQYNAEAGLEAARVVLANSADKNLQWLNQLPTVRAATWNPGAAVLPAGAASGRDYENAACDTRGGVGYGKVIVDTGTVRYENVSTYSGESVNGAFTLWIRRPLKVTQGGQFTDETANDRLIIVSEGVAPYTGTADAFTRGRQAVRVLETRFALALTSVGNPCGLGKQQGQEGGSPMGENFNPCAPVTTGVGGSLGDVFGGAGGGDLKSTGAQ
jgi:Tfp pilus assembly protein PilX